MKITYSGLTPLGLKGDNSCAFVLGEGRDFFTPLSLSHRFTHLCYG